MAVALGGADGSGVLLLINAAFDDVGYVLPSTGSKRHWRLRLDSGEGTIDPEAPALLEDAAVTVSGRSLQIYSL